MKVASNSPKPIEIGDTQQNLKKHSGIFHTQDQRTSNIRKLDLQRTLQDEPVFYKQNKYQSSSRLKTLIEQDKNVNDAINVVDTEYFPKYKHSNKIQQGGSFRTLILNDSGQQNMKLHNNMLIQSERKKNFQEYSSEYMDNLAYSDPLRNKEMQKIRRHNQSGHIKNVYSLDTSAYDGQFNRQATLRKGGISSDSRNLLSTNPKSAKELKYEHSKYKTVKLMNQKQQLNSSLIEKYLGSKYIQPLGSELDENTSEKKQYVMLPKINLDSSNKFVIPSSQVSIAKRLNQNYDFPKPGESTKKIKKNASALLVSHNKNNTALF